MISFPLPPYEIKTTQRNGHTAIFDFLRRRYVALTPEEWVRQHFTHYLVDHLHYPAALLANEVSLRAGRNFRRCDTVLYRREGGTPRLIVEYKAPTIPITQEVVSQIAGYNSLLRADYLMISNGHTHFCCHMDYERLASSSLPEIPDYKDLA